MKANAGEVYTVYNQYLKRYTAILILIQTIILILLQEKVFITKSVKSKKVGMCIHRVTLGINC